MENPQNKWRFLAGKTIYKWAIFHGYVSHNQMAIPLFVMVIRPLPNMGSQLIQNSTNGRDRKASVNFACVDSPEIFISSIPMK
jgi:hypothetical protein